MKRTSILILIGTFIITTCYLTLGKDEAMYQKKKAFTTKDEIMETINGKELIKEDDVNYKRKITDEFNECLSERLRASNEMDHNYKIEIDEQVELDGETKESLLKAYKKLRKSYYNARPINNIDVIRVNAQTYYSKDSSARDKSSLDIVFIDEGEGLVIDYLDSNIDSRHGIEE